MDFFLCILLCMTFAAPVRGTELPEWTQKIRRDHPRLFFNSDTWPSVRKRALGAENAWYRSIKKKVDSVGKRNPESKEGEAQELGPQAAWAAFVYRVTGEEKYRKIALRCLEASILYYEKCFEERKTVNWYSTTRVHAILAWDWLYDSLDAKLRTELLSRMITVIDNVLTVRPAIYRENMSGYSTGFYGVRNCLWFLGCTAFGTGVKTEKVNEYLVWGYNENMKLLAHRKKSCGDDGGGASSTLGYVLGAYPWAEQNFFYTWWSSTGENKAPRWPHSALLANYALWNWIPSEEGPLEFGYGDTPHMSNRMPLHQMYSHMANIEQLYSDEKPFQAQFARYLQKRLPSQHHSRSWFIYPFLFTGKKQENASFDPACLPQARHFETMGQVIMRSGMGPEDTYCMFSCGGILRQHRHYDALNFVLYHKGFLALDSGTRYGQFVNGRHLANYYAQTVAHNCVVIHQKGEPPARYWGGTVEDNHGGQHSQLGSKVVAFETNDSYTYVAGDATECYQHGKVRLDKNRLLLEKCSEVTRQLVFLPPDFLVVFDRVESTKEYLRKDWLLHTAEKPHIDGAVVRADHRKGRMFCRTVLPEDAKLKTVGGPGKAFFAAGKNWALEPGSLTDGQLALMGQWRVEVTPGAPRKRDVFLHVIQVGDISLDAMVPVSKVTEGEDVGVRIEEGERTWQVTFTTDGSVGGRIRRVGKAPHIDAPLTRRVQRQVGILAKPYERVTMEEAKADIPGRELPPFWIGDVKDLGKRFERLKRGSVKMIAKSPGGRPLHLITYGEREKVTAQANFNSAVGAREPAAYMNKQARKKPVIFFIGPVHGHEVEALTGLVNLIEVMETGRDLAGRAQAELQKLGDECRLLILPAGNPDGIARFAPRSLNGMKLRDIRFWGQGTWADQTLCGWPESKRLHPMTPDKVGFLGCYFNDAGVNPMHDEFFAPFSSEAPAILKIAQREGPDLAVSLHSHGNPPAVLRPAYMPLEVQDDVSSLARLYYQLLDKKSLPHARAFSSRAESGRPPAPFNLTSAVYHVSGARTFTHECPHGTRYKGSCVVTCEQILDIQLTLYEAMMRHELEKKKP